MDDKGGDMRNCEQEILCCFANTGCDTERNRFDTWVRGCDCPTSSRRRNGQPAYAP
jgi:hypothetical protein